MSAHAVFWLGTCAALVAATHAYVTYERDLIRHDQDHESADRVKRQVNWDSSEDTPLSQAARNRLQSISDRVRRLQQQQQADNSNDQNYISSSRTPSWSTPNNNQNAGSWTQPSDGGLLNTAWQGDRGSRRPSATTATDRTTRRASRDDGDLDSRTWGANPLFGDGTSYLGGGNPLLGGGSSYLGGGNPLLGGGSSYLGGGNPVLGGGSSYLGGGNTLLGGGNGGGLFGLGSSSYQPSVIGSLIGSIGQGLSSAVQGVSSALVNKWNTKVNAARGLTSSFMNTGRTALRSGLQAGMAHPRFAVDAVQNLF